jgi:hypothetical protein
MRRLDQNTIMLCRKNSCCPKVITEESGNIKITDDFGGEVKLTKDEVEMLKELLDGKVVE